MSIKMFYAVDADGTGGLYGLRPEWNEGEGIWFGGGFHELLDEDEIEALIPERHQGMTYKDEPVRVIVDLVIKGVSPNE